MKSAPGCEAILDMTGTYRNAGQIQLFKRFNKTAKSIINSAKLIFPDSPSDTMFRLIVNTQLSNRDTAALKYCSLVFSLCLGLIFSFCT